MSAEELLARAALGTAPGHDPAARAGRAVIAVAGLKAIAGLFSVVFLAFMIAIGVAPLGNWLRRKGAPGWVSGSWH